MRIVVIASPAQYDEFTATGMTGDSVIERMEQPCATTGYQAVIDFLHSPDAYPVTIRDHASTLFFFNDITGSGENRPPHFIRFNGWPGFVKGPLLEAACASDAAREQATNILACFSKKPEWVTDQPGFISARVLAAVINEAWLTLEEGVSTKEAIDTAMKLGTNYPFGPFEWTEKIGAGNIAGLLTLLAETAPRYQPAPLLIKEAIA